MDVALSVSSLDFTSGLAEYLRGGHVIWAYALLAATTAPPLVPNSVLLVTGGVMAAEGHLNLALVLLVVAGSAVLGDLAMHRTGQALSTRVLGRIGCGDQQLRRHTADPRARGPVHAAFDQQHAPGPIGQRLLTRDQTCRPSSDHRDVDLEF